MKEKEEQIIVQLRRGENRAYKYLYDHYYNLLCKVAYGFLKDDFLAETIVDDTIFNLYEKRESLLITTSLKSYLIKSVRNRCVNFLELKYNEKEVSFSSIGHIDDSLHLLPGTDDYPLGILLEKELEHEIQQAIERLPKESRTVFEMSRFENKRYEEIAGELNISINTVKYHIKNALSLLNADLKRYLTTILLFLLGIN